MRSLLPFALATTLLLAGCTAPETDDQDDEVQALKTQNAQLQAEVDRLQSQAGSTAGGFLWTFSPNKISVYDPLKREPVATIAVSNLSWGDGVVTADNSKILVNEQSKNEVVVIDTKERKIIKNIPVGQRPVHMYNPHYGKEVWTHADGDGSFYVINTDTLTVTHIVAASLKTPPAGHGKLLWAPELQDKAYATNTGDNAVHVIDLAQHKATGTIKTCQGTHGTSYAQLSGFAYFACGGPRTISVVDPKTDTFVKNLTEVGSQVWPGAHEPIMHHKEPLVLSGGSKGVKVIDVNTNEIVRTLNATGLGHMEQHKAPDGTTYFLSPHNDLPIVYVLDPSNVEPHRLIYTGTWKPADKSAQHGTSITASDKHLFVARETDGIVSVIDMDNLVAVNSLVVEAGVGTPLFVEA